LGKSKGFGPGVARLCGVAAARTAQELRKLVEKALQLTPTVELRLDWLKSDEEREEFLKWVKKVKRKNTTFLATCRRRLGGGEFSGDAGAELYWLMRAREAGCEWCDLEVETLEELPGKSVRGFGVPENVLLSIHDFQRTPRLPGLGKLPERSGADAIKIAAMSRSIADSVRLLRVARKSEQVVAVPMGEVGLAARILALREGSALAYAPVGAATAPGQIGMRELKELYRAHTLTKRSKVFGVIGDPIGHSLSPLLHNTGYIKKKMDAIFVPFLVGRLDDFLKAVADFGISAFSVTIPHKRTIMRHLNECEELAEQIGAVNTVTVGKNGALRGSNTDYVGALRALEGKMSLRGRQVLIFGAGGSARAAAFAAAKAGAKVFVSARRETAARELARAVDGEVVARKSLRRREFDVIVNATPVGMYPHEGVSPLAAGELNCGLVMDLIYRPMQTKLLKIAAARGLQTVSGVEMFLAQGIAQWELWTGQPAPEAAMRRAVVGALRNEEQRRTEEQHRW
jgi:3-dehydroquinate dehydratase / shikimate dehydrogenase